MYKEELKIIEVLIKHLYDSSNLEELIEKEFSSEEEYNYHRINVFNLISIYTILAHKKNSFDIDYDKFLREGTTYLFTDKTISPVISFNKKENSYKVIKEIIKCLEKNEFSFDKYNNVIISNDKLNICIPSEWLYRLSIVAKDSEPKQINIINGKQTKNIKDENSLLNYLYNAQKFIVSTKESENQDVDFDVSKYYLSSLKQILHKGKNSNFYNLTLEEQESCLNRWINEIEFNVDKSYDALQKFILLAKPNNSKNKENNLEEEKVLIGLFNTYINTLVSSKIDLFDISLTNFKLKSYVSKKTTELIKRLRKVVKKIDENKKDNDVLSSNLESFLSDVKDGKNIVTDSIKHDFEKYREKTEKTMNLMNERNTLQNIINYENEHSIEDIAFDNEKIIHLIQKATQKGRIYLSEFNNNKIIIELYDNKLSKLIFKTEITIDNLITLIENTNFYLEENNNVALRKIAV